jgi:probable HAF family extracellular repeat protein
MNQPKLHWKTWVLAAVWAIAAEAPAAPESAGFVFANGHYAVIDVPGSNSSTAEGINNAGWIVGTFMTDSNETHGFLTFDGAFTVIDVPGAAATSASGINSSGQIIGTFTDRDGRQHGFLDSGGSFRTIDFPGASDTILGGLNDAGQIVGTAVASSQLAFLYVDGSFSIILGSADQAANGSGINNAGQVVGTASSGGFLYANGSFAAINLPGATGAGGITFVNNINNVGQVVGFSQESGCCIGFVANLDARSFSTIIYPGSLLTQPNGINDAGVIVGRFLGPVPEPSSQLLFSLGLFTWALARHRRQRPRARSAAPQPHSC